MGRDRLFDLHPEKPTPGRAQIGPPLKRIAPPLVTRPGAPRTVEAKARWYKYRTVWRTALASKTPAPTPALGHFKRLEHSSLSLDADSSSGRPHRVELKTER
jgi:hypothetical protein